MTTPTMTRRLAAGAVAAATLAGGLMALPAHAADSVYDITIKAASAEAGGNNTLKGRKYTAYKLADYVDGTFVNKGDPQLDGVAVDTPDALKPDLDRVLAKTTGVSDVSSLPGWADAFFTASSTPSFSRASSALFQRKIPAPISLSVWWDSNTRTSHPCWRRAIAMDKPANPPPAISARFFMTLQLLNDRRIFWRVLRFSRPRRSGRYPP